MIKEEIRHICEISNIKFNDTLSEKFLKDFKDKVKWSYISCNQKLSENIIRKFIDKLNAEFIIQNNKVISEDFKKLLKVWS